MDMAIERNPNRTDTRRAYEVQRDKTNTKHYGFKLQLSTDADIIEFLETLENKQGFIKSALREAIKSAT